MRLRADYVRLCATHIIVSACGECKLLQVMANYVKLCATHIIIRAWRRAQVIDHYVKLCEIMCNSHNYLRVVASASPLQITTEILKF